jgi:preprotein translocase SecE subunit
VQAAQLPDDKIEAEQPRPGRVQQVLPLVRAPHAASGIALMASEAIPERSTSNPLGKVWRYINESIAELKKVQWPGQNQVVQGTVVVLIACLIVGVYLYLNDIVWKHFVSQVLLR